MFSGQLPHYVEPRKLADQGGTVSGQTTVGELPRLSDLSQDPGGPIRFDLSFGRSAEEGLRVVQGDVAATLTMTCQRCLEPVVLTARAVVSLALVSGEDEAGDLPERFDPWLLDEERVSLVPLLEEELLLALPLVALHEHCPAPAAHVVQAEPEPAPRKRADNPFAILARLKHEDDQE